MRKRKIVLISLPFVMILLMGTPFYLTSSLSAPSIVAATPKEAIDTYIKALHNKDVDMMIALVRDDDYAGDFAYQRSDYQELTRRNSLVSFTILSETKLDENTFEYLSEVKFSNDDPTCPHPPIPLKVIRDPASDMPSWKVWLENWDLNCTPNSPAFGQLTHNPHSRGTPSLWEQSKHLFKTTLGIR